MVFGTAAWKLIPEMGPDVLALVENRAVTLTTLGLEASAVGVKVRVRPEEGDV